MERYSLAIIIPAFNESNTITNIVKNCLKYGDVFVINDGSKDKSCEIAKQLSKNYVNVELISLDKLK